MSVVRSPAELVGFRAGAFYRMDFVAAAARICCFRCSVSAARSNPVDCSQPKGLLRKASVSRNGVGRGPVATFKFALVEALSRVRISRTRAGERPCIRCRATVTYQPYK